ncbi:MAG: hypothetical protein JRC90_08770 [Deltaproteobacteria bacterium]|nr:hypothetical protein [Deltaproteobacteria bacterium]
MFKYIKYFILILVLCAQIGIPKANAATINAATCSQADVQAAVNSASHGDTVIVPAGDGSATWDDLDIAAGITLEGPGSGSLTITAGAGAEQIIDLELGHNQATRITGFRFDGNSGASHGIYGEVQTDVHKNDKLRIDHCTFDECNRNIYFNYWIAGVVDNCEFINPRGSCITLYGDASTSWTRAGTSGSADALYVEDCTFTYTKAAAKHYITSNKGARYVFRFNSGTTNYAGRPYDICDAHGYCCASPAGTYLYEIYGNTFRTIGSGHIGSMVRIRGGQGMVFDNALVGDMNGPEIGKEIELSNYRSYQTYVNSSCSGSCKTLCTEYPCKHQINNLYIWNNTDDENQVTTYVEDLGSIRTHVQADRDFWTYDADFDGSSGVGRGTHAERPATCTTGVAYWETDTGGNWSSKGGANDGCLYKCTSTNNWELYYTPYTYPHPLTQGSSYTLSSPSNLHVIQ